MSWLLKNTPTLSVPFVIDPRLHVRSPRAFSDALTRSRISPGVRSKKAGAQERSRLMPGAWKDGLDGYCVDGEGARGSDTRDGVWWALTALLTSVSSTSNSFSARSACSSAHLARSSARSRASSIRFRASGTESTRSFLFLSERFGGEGDRGEVGCCRFRNGQRGRPQKLLATWLFKGFHGIVRRKLTQFNLGT
jgi:hypothetical protein